MPSIAIRALLSCKQTLHVMENYEELYSFVLNKRNPVQAIRIIIKKNYLILYLLCCQEFKNIYIIIFFALHVGR